MNTVKEILQKTANFDDRGHLDPNSFNGNVRFYTYAPADDLAHILEHFWIIERDEASVYTSEQVMHRPYTDIFFSTKEMGIQGTFRGVRTYRTEGKDRIIGARFLPGAFHLFWKGSMADLQDSFVDIHTVFPQITRQFADSLLERDNETAIRELATIIRTRLPSGSDANIALIQKIIAAIEQDDDLRTVALVAKRFARSERTLQLMFQDYIGIGLKWFLQRHKLLAAAKIIREHTQPDWVRIAYDIGYSSQQHFISDFKKVLGKTPRQYKLHVTTDAVRV
jgi:AraC-like DNA-binding protein